MKVFIVENSEPLRERLARIVSTIRGVQVVGHAERAGQAVEKIKETRPDVVLLDIRLDQGTGYQVLEQVKSGSRPPIVIVLTNYAYPQFKKKYLEGGADYFFDKSAELDGLLSVIRKLAAGPGGSSGPQARPPFRDNSSGGGRSSQRYSSAVGQ
jgi:DNA-binding NarL/FixJ family response regulator